MILNEYVKLRKKGLRKIKYYKSIGYDINKNDEFIYIKVCDLTSGSRQLIKVKCDFCDKVLSVTYKEYLRNVSIGGKYACCKSCGSKKAKKSNILKYGVKHPMKLEDVQEKTKKTNVEKYGSEYLQQSEYIKEKTKKTLKEKYGDDHISKSEEIRKITSKISLDKNYKKYIGDNLSLLSCIEGSHDFSIKNDNYYYRKKNNLPICTICYPISDNISMKEIELFKYIDSIYNGKIIKSYRDGLEIDIYLPELNLGFEFNGLYWHSEEFKDKSYHIDKTNYFKEKGIRIIHIWEDDWTNKRTILESQIKNWLGLTETKIWARKCQVKEIKKSKISTQFLEENHIQGKVGSNLKLGLYYDEELISLMTFDKNEGRKKMSKNRWNINRFCNKLNYNIVGGASKLLNHFIKNYNPEKIISYADKDWSLGDIYYKLGFKKVSDIGSDYKYISENKRVHKSRFKKSNLGIKGLKITEREYTKSIGINRIWDCGKIKFEKLI